MFKVFGTSHSNLFSPAHVLPVPYTVLLPWLLSTSITCLMHPDALLFEASALMIFCCLWICTSQLHFKVCFSCCLRAFFLGMSPLACALVIYSSIYIQMSVKKLVKMYILLHNYYRNKIVQIKLNWNKRHLVTSGSLMLHTRSCTRYNLKTSQK